MDQKPDVDLKFVFLLDRKIKTFPVRRLDGPLCPGLNATSFGSGVVQIFVFPSG